MRDLLPTQFDASSDDINAALSIATYDDLEDAYEWIMPVELTEPVEPSAQVEDEDGGEDDQLIAEAEEVAERQFSGSLNGLFTKFAAAYSATYEEPPEEIIDLTDGRFGADYPAAWLAVWNGMKKRPTPFPIGSTNRGENGRLEPDGTITVAKPPYLGPAELITIKKDVDPGRNVPTKDAPWDYRDKSREQIEAEVGVTPAQSKGDPPEFRVFNRNPIELIDPPDMEPLTMTVEQVREVVAKSLGAVDAEAMRGGPSNTLYLVRSAAGTGKTYQAIKTALEFGMTPPVMFCTPRRDMFDTVKAAAEAQGFSAVNLYKWKPRRGATEELNTCKEINRMDKWIGLGRKPEDLCRNNQVCGYSYMKLCPYLDQARQKEKVIVGDHRHLIYGNLIKQYSLVIGDENPMAAFENEIIIKYDRLPQAKNESTTGEFMRAVAAAIQFFKQERDGRNAGRKMWDGEWILEGRELLDALGGAEQVQQWCKDLDLTDFYELYADRDEIKRNLDRGGKADEKRPLIDIDLERATDDRGPQLLYMLGEEAELALASDDDYIPRVAITNDGLRLLCRHSVSNKFAGVPIIWFDATGDPEMYERLFGREVVVIEPQPKPVGKIIQVVGTTNNKTRVAPGRNVNEKKFGDLMVQVRAIEKKVGGKCAIISYENLRELVEGDDRDFANFWGSRGTNSLEGCAGLVVIGTPQIRPAALAKTAAMLLQDETDAFDLTMTQVDREFLYIDENGKGRKGPATVFKDDRLNLMLGEYRDNELIQAVNRARPAIRDVTIYLLTSHPVRGLRIDDMITVPDLLGLPETKEEMAETTRYASRELAEEIADREGYVTTRLLRAAGLGEGVSKRLMRDLRNDPGWEEITVIEDGAKRSSKAVRPVK